MAHLESERRDRVARRLFRVALVHEFLGKVLQLDERELLRLFRGGRAEVPVHERFCGRQERGVLRRLLRAQGREPR